MKKRLLILYTSAGAGHIRAAEALVQAAHNSHPEIEVLSRDALDLMPALVRQYYGASYLVAVNRAPELWGYLYDYTDRTPANSRSAKILKFFDRLNSRKLLALVSDFGPDAIICTHFLPANVLQSAAQTGDAKGPGFLRGLLPGRKGVKLPPVSMVLTDYDVHSYCVHERTSAYFVPSDEVRHQLQARRVPADRIHVTGIPVLPIFEELSPVASREKRPRARRPGAGVRSDAALFSPARARVRDGLGIGRDENVVLLLSGGFGVGNVNRTLESLLELDAEFRILAVAGKNQELRAGLEKTAARRPGRVTVFGFVQNMHELMAAADLSITKSGGLTVSESLALGLPMIVFAPIPGQEVANCNYLLENGAALLAKDVSVLAFKREKLLRSKET
ncbi:MAG: glycosyltransferase, partial [Planctomycetota bacterium]|nr:glycosyltransferase [Planctomycetota bacterium]